MVTTGQRRRRCLDLKLKRVEVTWLDSTEFAGWESFEDARTHKPFAAKTLGFLWHDCEEFISVVQTIGEAGCLMGILVIPRGCIQNIKELGVTEVEVEGCDGKPPEAP